MPERRNSLKKPILFAVITHETSEEHSHPYAQSKLGQCFSFSGLHTPRPSSEPVPARRTLPPRLRSRGRGFLRTASTVCASRLWNSGRRSPCFKPCRLLLHPRCTATAQLHNWYPKARPPGEAAVQTGIGLQRSRYGVASLSAGRCCQGHPLRSLNQLHLLISMLTPSVSPVAIYLSGCSLLPPRSLPASLPRLCKSFGSRSPPPERCKRGTNLARLHAGLMPQMTSDPAAPSERRAALRFGQ